MKSHSGTSSGITVRQLVLALIAVVAVGGVGYYLYHRGDCAAAIAEAVTLTGPTCRYADTLDALFQQHAGNTCANTKSCPESLYFIDDTNENWERRKERHFRQVSRQSLLVDSRSCEGATVFQNTWEPSFTCGFEDRIGYMGDGGKWVCDPHRLVALPGRCIVYSLGSNGVFDFEESVWALRPDCEIHTFDPTSPAPTAADAAKLSFHAYGLGRTDGYVPIRGLCGNHCEVKSLPSILQDLGHQHSVIDIFKIDIEGMEYETLTELLWTCTFPLNIRMILIELHSPADQTLPLRVQKLMLGLQHAGYAIYHKEPNTIGCRGRCIEYSFVRTAFTV